MIEIHKDTDNILQSPFQDEIRPDNFYAGAGRGDLLVCLKSAVENGVPLIVMSGDGGSGKTMMCRMVETECPSSHIAVFFSSTVESFEDVVRKICKRLELQLAGADEGKNIDAAIGRIIDHLSRQSKGLLVIFDEAEDIYLATLERIRKMLDRITAAGVRMQIIFSGRKTFLENCEQLSICDFRNTENLHFDVLPLGEHETSEYLRFCLDRLASPDKRKVFNDEVVRNIHELAEGNFRRINRLADESLRSQGDDTSFMTLLDSVKDETDVAAGKGKKSFEFAFSGRGTHSLWWLAGALCILFLLFFLLRPGEERRVIKSVSLPPTNDTARVKTATRPREEQQQSLQPAAVHISQLPSQSPGNAEKPPETTGQENPLKIEAGTSGSGETSGIVVDQTPVVADLPTVIVSSITKQEGGSPPAPFQHKVVAANEAKVPELRQIPPLKVKPKNSPEPAVNDAKSQPRRDVQEIGGTSPQLTVDQLFLKRLNAGTVWASGGKNEKFTIQIMVLTAKNAELNLKKMLAQPNYRKEAGNFFIFKKNGSPEVVLVFYGEYPSMELARLAQNSLPLFLRDQQPYAISIKGAIAKVGK